MVTQKVTSPIEMDNGVALNVFYLNKLACIKLKWKVPHQALFQLV